MAECECGHDHEIVYVTVPGSEYDKKWNAYRLEIEAIVVRTYASLDERRSDRQPRYPGFWYNPNNPLQLVRPIIWRVYYKTARAYGEGDHHGAARILGLRLDHPESRTVELAVRKGLDLISRARGEAQPGAGRKPGRNVTLALLDRRIGEIFEQDRKAHRQSKITYKLLVRFQGYSTTTAFNVLKDEGHTTLTSRVAFLKKSFTK